MIKMILTNSIYLITRKFNMTGACRLGDICTGHGCVVGSTKIRLLDGTIKEIKNLVGKSNFYVYSINNRNEIVPGLVEKVFITGIKPTLKIILDNNRYVIASSDHKFITSSGHRVEARFLKPNNKLMTFHSKVVNEKCSINNYEKVFQPFSKRWMYTHHMVYEWKYGKPIIESLNETYYKNLNTLNNEPSNLYSVDRSKNNVLYSVKNYAKRLGNNFKELWDYYESRDDTIQDLTIVKIIELSPQLVYNMSVSITHNYAISAGIFINNCWPPRPNATASDDTFVNGRGSHRLGDMWQVHCCPPPCHDGSLAGGSDTIYVNSKPHGRIGDPVSCGSSVMTGSDDVILDEG